MADKSFFSRLKKLFSTSVIVRNKGGKKLKLVDLDSRQSQSSRPIDRFNKVFKTGGMSGYSMVGQQASFIANRRLLYGDYEIMDTDSIISTALNVLSDECTTRDEYNDVLQIKTDNEDVKDILNNLYYDVLNIEFNLWPWIRNLVKYGDHFLLLTISEEFGVTFATPLSAYETERVEGEDPDNPHLVQFKNETIAGRALLENYEVAHFRLLSDTNFLPYGKSMLEGARRVWKQLNLMEDAMLIHRIMRSPEKRIFNIEVGNLPPNEIDTHMEQTISRMKKIPFVDPNTGDYNLKFNLENMLEDIYIPTRGGLSTSQVTNLNGLAFDNINDIEYLRDKLFAALQVPKAFLNYSDAYGAKATLAAEDIRFTRTIERLQRIVVSELYKIGVIHLAAQGFEDEELIEFDLELTNPSTVHKQQKVELWKSQIELAKDLQDSKLFSDDWIYENVFDMNEDEIEDERAKLVETSKRNYRLTKINEEGSDPADPRSPDPDPIGDQSPEDENDNSTEDDNPGAAGWYPGTKDMVDDKPLQQPKSPFGHRFKGGSPLSQK